MFPLRFPEWQKPEENDLFLADCVMGRDFLWTASTLDNLLETRKNPHSYAGHEAQKSRV
jgi:hypothetical protein